MLEVAAFLKAFFCYLVLSGISTKILHLSWKLSGSIQKELEQKIFFPQKMWNKVTDGKGWEYLELDDQQKNAESHIVLHYPTAIFQQTWFQ